MSVRVGERITSSKGQGRQEREREKNKERMKREIVTECKRGREDYQGRQERERERRKERKKHARERDSESF